MQTHPKTHWLTWVIGILFVGLVLFPLGVVLNEQGKITWQLVGKLIEWLDKFI